MASGSGWDSTINSRSYLNLIPDLKNLGIFQGIFGKLTYRIYLKVCFGAVEAYRISVGICWGFLQCCTCSFMSRIPTNIDRNEAQHDGLKHDSLNTGIPEGKPTYLETNQSTTIFALLSFFVQVYKFLPSMVSEDLMKKHIISLIISGQLERPVPYVPD